MRGAGAFLFNDRSVNESGEARSGRGLDFVHSNGARDDNSSSACTESSAVPVCCVSVFAECARDVRSSEVRIVDVPSDCFVLVARIQSRNGIHLRGGNETCLHAILVMKSVN